MQAPTHEGKNRTTTQTTEIDKEGCERYTSGMHSWKKPFI